MKKLIVIDMQRDFVTGDLGTPEAIAIVPNINRKIEEYRSRCDEVFFTRDTHTEDYFETNEGKHLPVPHCIYETDGWQITDRIHWGFYNSTVLNKPTFGFLHWDKYLNVSGEGEDAEIEIVGVCTDICVVSNALILKAMYPEAKITVDASCCAGVTPESHKAALTTMKMCQIEVIGE